MTAAPVGVLLLSFGSAVTAEEVPRYLASVRRGRPPSPEVETEMARRYALIGRSPLIDITRRQAAELQRLLDSEAGVARYRVVVGMLHSDPPIAEALTSLAALEVEVVVAIVMAPQYSPIIMAGYHRALEAARTGAGSAVSVRLAQAWHREPGLVCALAERAREALGRLPEERSVSVPVIFTAHSLPRAVIERDPGYIDQIMETVEAVAAAVPLDRRRWQFAYQSAGHTPEEWLTPDFRDLMPGLRAGGHREVLVVPTQFLADHLEVLYDIDIAGREEAEREGMAFHRIEMPNTSPRLIRALAAVVGRETL